MIGCLRAGGFSVEMAAHAFLLLDSYIYGFVVQQMGFSLDGPESGGTPEATLQALPASQFPHLTEMAAEYVTKPGHDYTDEFDFGLDLILNGLETQLDSSHLKRGYAP